MNNQNKIKHHLTSPLLSTGSVTQFWVGLQKDQADGSCHRDKCNGLLTWADREKFEYSEELYEKFSGNAGLDACFMGSWGATQAQRDRVMLLVRDCDSKSAVVCMRSPDGGKHELAAKGHIEKGTYMKQHVACKGKNEPAAV